MLNVPNKELGDTNRNRFCMGFFFEWNSTYASIIEQKRNVE